MEFRDPNLTWAERFPQGVHRSSKPASTRVVRYISEPRFPPAITCFTDTLQGRAAATEEDDDDASAI